MSYQTWSAEEMSDHFLIAANDNNIVSPSTQNALKKAQDRMEAANADAQQAADATVEDAKISAVEKVDKAENSETLANVKEQGKDFIDGLDFANPSWDVFLILFFLVAALLYGISLGRDRIIVILISIYMALAVVETVPNFILNIDWNNQYAFQITTFISVFVILFFLISRSALLRTLGNNASRGKFLHTIIFSVLHVGLMISISMTYLPASMIGKFAPFTQTIFTNEWMVFAWVVAPIVAMIVLGRREED
ncbi:MAG: hypothetical protein ABIG66_01750 [Candidatus Kerfeldbacteria bacterium]